MMKPSNRTPAMDPIQPNPQPAAAPPASRNPAHDATSRVQQVANRALSASPGARMEAQPASSATSACCAATVGTIRPGSYEVEARGRTERALAEAETILARRRASAPRCLSTIEAALHESCKAPACAPARASAAAYLLYGLFGPGAPLAGQLVAREPAAASTPGNTSAGADPASTAMRRSASEQAIDAYRQFVRATRSAPWFIAQCSALDAACARLPPPDFATADTAICKEIVGALVHDNHSGVRARLNRLSAKLFGWLRPLLPAETCAVARENCADRVTGTGACRETFSALTPESGTLPRPPSSDRWRDVVLDAAQRAMEDATGLRLAESLRQLREQATAGIDGRLQAAARDLIDFASENAVHLTPAQAEALDAALVEIFASIDPSLEAPAERYTPPAEAAAFRALESVIVAQRHPIAWHEVKETARACVPDLPSHGRVTARLEGLRSELADIPQQQHATGRAAENAYLQKRAADIYAEHGVDRARIPFARWEIHSHLEKLAESAVEADWDAVALWSSLAIQSLHSTRQTPGAHHARYDQEREVILRHIAICLSQLPDNTPSHHASDA